MGIIVSRSRLEEKFNFSCPTGQAMLKPYRRALISLVEYSIVNKVENKKNTPLHFRIRYRIRQCPYPNPHPNFAVTPIQ